MRTQSLKISQRKSKMEVRDGSSKSELKSKEESKVKVVRANILYPISHYEETILKSKMEVKESKSSLIVEIQRTRKIKVVLACN